MAFLVALAPEETPGGWRARAGRRGESRELVDWIAYTTAAAAAGRTNQLAADGAGARARTQGGERRGAGAGREGWEGAGLAVALAVGRVKGVEE